MCLKKYIPVDMPKVSKSTSEFLDLSSFRAAVLPSFDEIGSGSRQPFQERSSVQARLRSFPTGHSLV